MKHGLIGKENAWADFCQWMAPRRGGVVLIAGERGSGRKTLARAMAAEIGLPVATLSAGDRLLEVERRLREGPAWRKAVRAAGLVIWPVHGIGEWIAELGERAAPDEAGKICLALDWDQDLKGLRDLESWIRTQREAARVGGQDWFIATVEGARLTALAGRRTAPDQSAAPIFVTRVEGRWARAEVDAFAALRLGSDALEPEILSALWRASGEGELRHPAAVAGVLDRWLRSDALVERQGRWWRARAGWLGRRRKLEGVDQIIGALKLDGEATRGVELAALCEQAVPVDALVAVVGREALGRANVALSRGLFPPAWKVEAGAVEWLDDAVRSGLASRARGTTTLGADLATALRWFETQPMAERLRWAAAERAWSNEARRALRWTGAFPKDPAEQSNFLVWLRYGPSLHPTFYIEVFNAIVAPMSAQKAEEVDTELKVLCTRVVLERGPRPDPGTHAAMLNVLALHAFRAGQAEEACEALEEACQLVKDSEAEVLGYSMNLLDLGGAWGARGDLARCLQSIRRAADLRPRSSANQIEAIRSCLADLAACMHRWSEARQQVGDLRRSSLGTESVFDELALYPALEGPELPTGPPGPLVAGSLDVAMLHYAGPVHLDWGAALDGVSAGVAQAFRAQAALWCHPEIWGAMDANLRLIQVVLGEPIDEAWIRSALRLEAPLPLGPGSTGLRLWAASEAVRATRDPEEVGLYFAGALGLLEAAMTEERRWFGVGTAFLWRRLICRGRWACRVALAELAWEVGRLELIEPILEPLRQVDRRVYLNLLARAERVLAELLAQRGELEAAARLARDAHTVFSNQMDVLPEVGAAPAAARRIGQWHARSAALIERLGA